MSGDGRILRVLTGRLAGTDKTLPNTGTISVGHQFWQDVVIRDEATKGIVVDLTLSADGAQITVLEGSAMLLGSAVAEGSTAILPPYVPFTIGGIALAWGDAGSERWGEADSLALTIPAPPLTPPGPREQATALATRLRGDVAAIATPRRVTIAASALAVGLLIIFAMPIAEAIGLRGTPAARVDEALARNGLPYLVVTPSGDGSDAVVVRGVVRGVEERERATATLRDTWVAGSLDVRTSAELAQAAIDAARIRGVVATARPIGRTAVELRTTPLDADKAQRLQAAVRGDVRDLTRLTMRGDLSPPDEAPLKAIADATKKVSTVVAGDPSYIQTVDGARYFSGAMMPSGHQLIGIQGNVVVFEKNGRQTRLVF